MRPLVCRNTHALPFLSKHRTADYTVWMDGQGTIYTCDGFWLTWCVRFVRRFTSSSWPTNSLTLYSFNADNETFPFNSSSVRSLIFHHNLPLLVYLGLLGCRKLAPLIRPSYTYYNRRSFARWWICCWNEVLSSNSIIKSTIWLK